MIFLSLRYNLIGYSVFESLGKEIANHTKFPVDYSNTILQFYDIFRAARSFAQKLEQICRCTGSFHFFPGLFYKNKIKKPDITKLSIELH